MADGERSRPWGPVRRAWVALRQAREGAHAARVLRRFEGDPESKWRECLEWLATRPVPGNPRVGCVITCHDDWDLLPDLLRSLREQSLADFGLVIVDDASREGRSVERRRQLAGLRSPGCTLVGLERNVGLAAARNRGIERLATTWVACLDADDILARDFLRATVSALESDPGLGFVYFDHYEFGATRRHVRSREFDLPALLARNYVVAAAPFRRDAWKAAGGYREEMTGGYEDWELWIRLARAGWRGRRLRRTLFYYRKREGSLLEGTLARHEEVTRFIRALHPDAGTPPGPAER